MFFIKENVLFEASLFNISVVSFLYVVIAKIYFIIKRLQVMIDKQNNIVITSAVRTAIGSFKGSLKDMHAHELGSVAIKEAIKRSNLNSSDVDEVIMGQVLTAAVGQNSARQASIRAGVPIEKTAYVINQVCGSGLRSVAAAYQSILTKDSSIVVAGGQESMSNAPHAINIHKEKKLEAKNLIDTMIHDGLLDAFNDYHMGITAENVAAKWKISREDQDNFALSSQTKTEKSQKEGKFNDEIVPIVLNSKENRQFNVDEHPRKKMTIDRLLKLKKVFKN